MRPFSFYHSPRLVYAYCNYLRAVFLNHRSHEVSQYDCNVQNPREGGKARSPVKHEAQLRDDEVRKAPSVLAPSPQVLGHSMGESFTHSYGGFGSYTSTFGSYASSFGSYASSFGYGLKPHVLLPPPPPSPKPVIIQVPQYIFPYHQHYGLLYPYGYGHGYHSPVRHPETFEEQNDHH